MRGQPQPVPHGPQAQVVPLQHVPHPAHRTERQAVLDRGRTAQRRVHGAPPLAVWFAGEVHEVGPDSHWSVPCR